MYILVFVFNLAIVLILLSALVFLSESWTDDRQQRAGRIFVFLELVSQNVI